MKEGPGVVVDATWILDCLIATPPVRAAASRVAHEYPECTTVALWRFEVGNVLRQYVRTGRLEHAQALTLLKDAEDLVWQTVTELRTDAILDLAESTGLRTFYDASYVWLARSRGLVLYTRDEGILLKCPDVARRYHVV